MCRMRGAFFMQIDSKPTTLFPLWNYDDEGRDTGIAVASLGFITNQNRMAVPTWSYAMEKWRPSRIVEIGAYNGGFTCALGVHAWNIGAQVYSFDKSEIPNTKYQRLAEFLGIHWFVMDCFSEIGVSTIIQLIQQPGITFLLCDGGNKVREMNTFAPFLKPGDVIGGHDYYAERPDYWPRSELPREAVADVLEGNSFTPFLQEHFDAAAWLVYRRLTVCK